MLWAMSGITEFDPKSWFHNLPIQDQLRLKHDSDQILDSKLIEAIFLAGGTVMGTAWENGPGAFRLLPSARAYVEGLDDPRSDDGWWDGTGAWNARSGSLS
jgi:hypothetical protein